MSAPTLVRQIGIYGVVACDCGHRKLLVGIQVKPGASNWVRLLECADRGEQMPVLFSTATTDARDGSEPLN